MPTKTTVKRRGPHRLRGTMSDASKLRNPNARPRRGNLRPMAETALCEVIDRTAEGIDPRMLILADGELGWDNMARWSILYRCIYRSCHEDGELHQRDFIAASRAGAIQKLQRRMVGFGVATVELFTVRPPLARDQVAAVRQANEDLSVERRRLGIYGDGPEREKRIEQWLATTDERG